jgi:hypothetical protein
VGVCALTFGAFAASFAVSASAATALIELFDLRSFGDREGG